jgi:N-acetylmuramoyl-L-alanine amidase
MRGGHRGVLRRAAVHQLMIMAVVFALGLAALAGCTQARLSAAAPAESPTSPSTAPATRTVLPARTPAQEATSTSRPEPEPRVSRTLSPSGGPSGGPSRGPTIVLNPGHNGGNAAGANQIARQVPAGFGQLKACDTTGTETNAGYPEHAFNYDVALRVRSLLERAGVTVLLTRNSDSGIGPCVDRRAAMGNQLGVAAVISIHADGAPVSGHGFHVCEDSRQPAGAAVAARSHSLTVAEHDALLASSGLTTSTYLGVNGYYARSDLAGLNLASVPATFLELGNMRNSGDASIQSAAIGRAKIAGAVAHGILAWLGR